jgi:hypothetical protein
MTQTPAELLEQARQGDATAAAALWRAIADGRADDATALAWAKDVAVQVVAKVLPTDLPANRRAEKARAALGLEGRVDQNAELKDLVLRTPGMTDVELARCVDLVIEVGKADWRQLKRKIKYIRDTSK